MELPRQPVATRGSGFRLFEPFWVASDLPPVATGGARWVAVEPPPAWRVGRTLQATVIAPDGKAVGAAGGALRNGVFVLPYARELNGHPVAAYRIAVGA